MSLQKVVDHASQLESVNKLLFVFSSGSSNYGLYQEGVSDRDYTAFFLPSLEQVVLGGVQRPRQVKVSAEVEYELVDVRNLLSRFNKANFASLDFLWAKERYVHDDAKALFKWLSENGYSLMKERSARLLKSHQASFKRQVLDPYLRGSVNTKKLSQQYYFLMLSSLLLDTKRQKRFYDFAKHANRWHETLGLSFPLLQVKAGHMAEEGVDKVFNDLMTLSLKLQDRKDVPKDVSFEESKLAEQLKQEVLKLFF